MTKRGANAAPARTLPVRDASVRALGCTVVGVGASAGGLEAFSELLRSIPPRTGLAFVLIQHLDPTHQSLLSDALRRATKLPVEEIRDRTRVERDHVYVIPPNADVALDGDTLRVVVRKPDARRPFLPIDHFLSSLAAAREDRAIGVVLTGMGSDGTVGLRAIKDAGGITLAEDPASAKFSGMPDAAIREGVVDFSFPLPRLVEELLRIARHPYLGSELEVRARLAVEGDDHALHEVLLLLRNALGPDFGEYKQPSFRRRLTRRMLLRGQPTLGDYLRLLRSDHAEVEALAEDLLIHVTSFFRDGGALDELERTAFPAILAGKPEAAPIRLWVAGCSTGEEVYSLAIGLLEFLAADGGSPRRSIQIFGTDVSERAIAKARAGIYPETIAQSVSAERLARFFEQLDGGRFRIAKHVRDLCAFARHDLARDPPFSKLDLVSCRNVLIYFDRPLQQRVLAAFHFALGLPGFLLLGRTETILDGNPLFTPADGEGKLFARTAARSALHLAPTHDLAPTRRRTAALTAPNAPPIDVGRRAEALLLDAYAPPGVVVNERGEILHFRGRTAPFLEPASGQPQHNVFKMASEGLLAALRTALSRARETRATVRREGVEVRANGETWRCNLVIMPVVLTPEAPEAQFAVLFERVVPPPSPRQRAAAPGGAKGANGSRGAKGRAPAETPRDAARVERLATELRATKDYLQTIIAEHEQTNEDLHASNEELVSSNEELQSLNEELGTAKEELQSTNEELSTLNEELQARNVALDAASGDIVNILSSVEVPIVIVDGARRIRRFTPMARTLMNLLPGDVGRPIGDIRPNLAIEDLERQIVEVIERLEPRQSEVRDGAGHWYRLQIRPYTTVDRRNDGAVLSLVDIDGLKRAVAAAELARDFATSTLAAVPTPLLLLDTELRVISANDAYYGAFRAPLGETERRSLFELLGGAWDSPALHEALAAAGKGAERRTPLELERELPSLGLRTLSLSAQTVRFPGGESMLLLAIRDVTERRNAEQERARLLLEAEQARATAESANRAKDVFLATLSHELRTPLTSLMLQAQLLSRKGIDEVRLRRVAEVIQRAARTQAQLIDDLLDVSRIVTGKLRMQPEAVSFAAVVRAALELVEPTLEKKGLELVTTLDDSLPPVWCDPLRLRQAVWNLLSNAVKFTPAHGAVRVTLDAIGGRARLRVADDGSGIEPAFLPRIFDRFSQEEQARSGGHGGLGLGLAIARYVLEASGGSLAAESAGAGEGSTFTLSLELMEPSALLPESRPSPVPGPKGIRGARVLLVDDDPLTREALVESLEANGAEVRSAESAAEALARFEEETPELVVCDIAMPGEDGYRLIERIRARDASHGGDVPALALTALATDEDRVRALAAGFQDHLAKPIELARLVAAIAKLSPPRAERLSQP